MPNHRTMDLDELCTREQIEIDELKHKLKKCLEDKTDYLEEDEQLILQALSEKPV